MGIWLYLVGFGAKPMETIAALGMPLQLDLLLVPPSPLYKIELAKLVDRKKENCFSTQTMAMYTYRC